MMTMKKPLISVVVAAYNQERFIGRCLRSLLHQTIPTDLYEIIVVDDGSTDRTPYAIELFHNAIHSIRNTTNLGLPTSLNRGIEAANGDFIVRVDADDYVNWNFLNFLHFYLAENTYVDAVACDYLLVDDMEAVLERCNCVEREIGCGIMFRKHQLEEVGLYDEGFSCHEDRDLRIRFEKKYIVRRLELPLYRYRRHGNNMTNNSDEMDRHRNKLIQKHGRDVTAKRTT